MSNVIKLNDNAELHLPCEGAAGVFRIFMNNYQVSLSSEHPRIDILVSSGFYMASTSSNGTEDFTGWNIDISREVAAALQVEGISFTEEAKEALSHE